MTQQGYRCKRRNGTLLIVDADGRIVERFAAMEPTMLAILRAILELTALFILFILAVPVAIVASIVLAIYNFIQSFRRK